MTYKDLLEALKELNEEQLSMSVCVVDASRECFDIEDTILSSEDLQLQDIVGDNQPLLLLAPVGPFEVADEFV